jgi:hypothetical protein
LAWEVFRGTRKYNQPIASLPEAQALVEGDRQHSPVLASPWGGWAAIRWAWDLDILNALNAENGRVAYTIRRIPGT